jgi:peptide/nickel transport system ATP-binding protein
MEHAPLLRVEDLTVDFVTLDGKVRILDQVSLSVMPGEIVGIVGESGSGKTTLGLTLLRLVDSPPAKIRAGSIVYKGRNLARLSPREMSALRGSELGIVLQESVESLNPVYTVGFQLTEAAQVWSKREHDGVGASQIKRRVVALLEELCISNPEAVMNRYPHELSGGMRKRVAIAMAVVQNPRLLILDEPTNGLDAYVQGRLLDLLRSLNHTYGMSMLIITHDLELAARVCDRVYVMYAGRILECSGAREILDSPLHPYTQALVSAIPSGYVDSPALEVPLGGPPELGSLPTGCKFHPRCPKRLEICALEEPVLTEYLARNVKCWLYAERQTT